MIAFRTPAAIDCQGGWQDGVLTGTFADNKWTIAWWRGDRVSPIIKAQVDTWIKNVPDRFYAAVRENSAIITLGKTGEMDVSFDTAYTFCVPKEKEAEIRAKVVFERERGFRGLGV